MIGTDTERLILGLGKTGYSIAAWLAGQGKSFRVIDTREQPPHAEAVRALCPEDRLHFGGWQQDWLATANELYVSPGLALSEPHISAALARGAELVSDIDLYRQESQVPVIAVTGSNGKSTVVRLLEKIAQDLGFQALAGGNIGRPVLELLQEPHDLAVLELSSFQLEMTHALKADVAMVLNISPDHQDRYADMSAYRAAKHRIFRDCQGIVVHADDPLTQPLVSEQMPRRDYSVCRHDLGLLSLTVTADGLQLRDGLEVLHTWDSLYLKGSHNHLNILAALSAGLLRGWPLAEMVHSVAEFRGLPHRCAWAGEVAGVTYINDSKGTNVGATLAALEGLAPECSGHLHLLAGGDGKNADFTPLGRACAEGSVRLQTYGRDGARIASAAQQQGVTATRHETLEAAFQAARRKAEPGDWIVLSPACASFDQFAGFEARGEAFEALVGSLQASTREVSP